MYSTYCETFKFDVLSMLSKAAMKNLEQVLFPMCANTSVRYISAGGIGGLHGCVHFEF